MSSSESMLSFQTEIAQGESRQMHNLDSSTEHLLSFNLSRFWENGWTQQNKNLSVVLSSCLLAFSPLALVCPPLGHLRGASCAEGNWLKSLNNFRSPEFL